METLVFFGMIGMLGLLMREVTVTREETKRVRKEAKAKARFDAEMLRTNKSVIESFKI